MKFVIFHGAFSHPEANWFLPLKEKLAALGQEVVVPDFPVENWEEVTKRGPKAVAKKQTLANWLKVFDKVRKSFKAGEELCFVAHSLGPLFVLQIVGKYKIQLDSAIFVSPFMRKLDKTWQIDKVNESFYKTDFNFKELRKLIPVSYVLYSDNDPYVDKRHSIGFAKRLNSSLLFVKRAAHMNAEVNMNEFPLVLELCKTRLDLSLYQKYLAHRQDLYAIDYIDPKSEEVIYLEPDEVFEEGVFKFRNLKKSGFCTFDTSLDFWDTQSGYFQQARLAAKRIKDFTRVFMVDKLADLQKKRLREQIKLDFNSGMRVYLCMVDGVRNKLTDLDFGVWDKEYLCTVRLKNNRYMEVRLSSRKKDITKALKDKEIILKKAVRIGNLERDLKAFVEKYG